MNLEDLQIHEDSRAILLYRGKKTGGRTWRRPLVNNIVGGFHLMAVLSGDYMTNNFYFRWHERFAFWRIERDDRRQNCYKMPNLEQGLIIHDWKVLVYVKSRHIAYMNEQLELGLLGQRKMRCNDHDLFLVKQPLSCQVPCCTKGCTGMARWRCQGKSDICWHAICFPHGRDVIRGDVVVNIEANMAGRFIRRWHAERDPIEEPPAEEEDQERDFLDEHDVEDDDPIILVPTGQNEIIDDVESAAPIHTASEKEPVYIQNNVPAHYIWNNFYDLMKRNNAYRDVRANALMEHIVSTTGNAAVSLLYPEGLFQ